LKVEDVEIGEYYLVDLTREVTFVRILCRACYINLPIAFICELGNDTNYIGIQAKEIIRKATKNELVLLVL